MQAVHYIAKRIKKYGKHFQICGNKDKRGITTQRATVIRGNPESLIRFQRARDWDNKIKVGSFEWVKDPLRLGQLSGNRFSVALRFIPKDISADRIAESKYPFIIMVCRRRKAKVEWLYQLFRYAEVRHLQCEDTRNRKGGIAPKLDQGDSPHPLSAP